MLNAGFLTIDSLKARILPEAGVEEPQWDAALGRLGLAVSRQLQQHCNRTFERVTDTSESYSARTFAVCLKAYPVEDIADAELTAQDGTATDAEVSFHIDRASGLLEFLAPPGSASQRLRITYTGGFWLDPEDGATTCPDGATPLPEDILEAFVSQCQAIAEARGLFGAVALRKTKDPQASGELLPEVEAALRGYRRFSGE